MKISCDYSWGLINLLWCFWLLPIIE